MEQNAQLVLKGLLAAALSLSACACSTPGSYFNNSDTRGHIRTAQQSLQPVVYKINASLYEQSNQDNSPQQKWWYKNNYNYLIGPSDVLYITVWDHPELSTPTTATQLMTTTTGGINTNIAQQSSATINGTVVDSTGSIFFPYVGTISINSMTTEQIRKKLSYRLKEYIKDPQVSVRVIEFRNKSLQVIGAVNQPGAVPINDKPTSILDAIAACGGIDPLKANMGQIFLVRGTQYQPIIFTLNAKNPSNLLLAEKFRIYPNDILYIPSAHIANWNETINQILPSISLAAYTKALSD
jgi:polysaccharide biosynthesis/export protein